MYYSSPLSLSVDAEVNNFLEVWKNAYLRIYYVLIRSYGSIVNIAWKISAKI